MGAKKAPGAVNTGCVKVAFDEEESGSLSHL